jgi:ADP-ribosyl-[dinitrogen reductase] hydrolase
MKNGNSKNPNQSDIEGNSTNELEGGLSIAVLELPNQGLIGITPCLGRNHTDKLGRIWRRNLQQDIAKISEWGAGSVLTLLEIKDLERLGVPNIVEEIQAAGLQCYHLPIPDMDVPGVEFDAAWKKDGENIMQSLRDGGKIIIHCAAGLGRSGMIAAKILSAFNKTPQIAISSVRDIRPGAIETDQQVDYVLHGPSI